MTAPYPTSPRWSDISEGDELPVFDLPLTASVIVAGAIASRDFMPVHHDRSFANQQGAPDIFMNILSDTGYFVTWVTTYFDADDEVVGRQRFRVFKFKPANATGETP